LSNLYLNKESEILIQSLPSIKNQKIEIPRPWQEESKFDPPTLEAQIDVSIKEDKEKECRVPIQVRQKRAKRN
jgi:hypothetical protein